MKLNHRSMTWLIRAAGALFIYLTFFGSAAVGASDLQVIALSVDATKAPLRQYHVRLVIPVTPGPLTLLYPQWIPGTHAPTGRIGNLLRLKLTALGQTLSWHRDPINLYAFHCQAPVGASFIEAQLDYRSDANDYYSYVDEVEIGAASTPSLAIINWNALLLYPEGEPVEQLSCAVHLKLPAGWNFATSVPILSHAQGTADFAATPLSRLIDSPLIAGAHFRTIRLDSSDGHDHRVEIVSDHASSLQLNSKLIAHWKRLVGESGALFGSRHYKDYRFLLVLSDAIPLTGLEHADCSLNTDKESLLDDRSKNSIAQIYVIPHEFVHSWNGKYRRPAGMISPDFNHPIDKELLWVYEGLTQYLGRLLAVRSGLETPEEFHERVAVSAAQMERLKGRTWRSLADAALTADMQPWPTSGFYAGHRSAIDVYEEGMLIWLEANAIIRQQSGGHRSLDDFCRAFFGVDNSADTVKPYTFDDLITALNDEAPYDWRGFFTHRVYDIAPHAPLSGITLSGWKLVYNANPPLPSADVSMNTSSLDMSYSIGLRVNYLGRVVDVIPGMAADHAGLTPGMTLAAVADELWDPMMMHKALRGAIYSKAPIPLQVINAAGVRRTLQLDYHRGDQYPHLQRDPSARDGLRQILMPLYPAAAPAMTPHF